MRIVPTFDHKKSSLLQATLHTTQSAFKLSALVPTKSSCRLIPAQADDPASWWCGQIRVGTAADHEFSSSTLIQKSIHGCQGSVFGHMPLKCALKQTKYWTTIKFYSAAEMKLITTVQYA